MVTVIFAIVGILSGFVLFRKITVTGNNKPFSGTERLSIIIPARNEEKNLPVILQSLKKQSYRPYEIIVVDDHSTDRTKEIAEGFGVKVIDNPVLPPGWTGKTWAVWNGYLHSSGDTLAFFDCDLNMKPDALAALLKERKEKGGVISVVPYHETKKFYEQFALITNILGIFAFTSPFEKNSRKKGLYGSCIITAREDYEKINGHSSIKSEVLDDLSIGGKYSEAGISINNFIGKGLISFRMYPDGMKSELQGFAKGAILSPNLLDFRTLLFTILWISGLIISESFVLFIGTSFFLPLLIGYLLYTVQILYLVRFTGYFGKLMPFLHLLSTLFFLIVILYSVYQVVFLRRVVWKGRNVEVGRKEEP